MLEVTSPMEGITVNGRSWHYCQLHYGDGNLKCVRLYDEDLYFVAEFPELAELMRFISTLQDT